MNKEQLKTLYNNLPQAIKAVYDRPETNDDIYDICEKYKLHIDQIGVVINTTYGVMLGLNKPTDFTNTFAKAADIPEDIANLITHDINEQIFLPIRQELMKRSGEWQPETSPKPLPTNVEPVDTHFSSSPYSPAKPEDPVKTELLDAIEHPTPTGTMITRDTFADKMGQLSQNQEKNENPTNSNLSKITTDKKADPYLEPIN
jgi:hypothetical protein